ncbi:ribonuclease HII [Nanoarchaeota archaeon]|nr:MAG: ribonuclease HII [Nanoarchaeota archaeon]
MGAFRVVAGIDEAGRGSVLGSMYIGYVEIDRQSKLKNIGVKDSKLLSPKRREKIAKQIKKIAKWDVIKVTPKEIDLRQAVKQSLTSLEGIKMAKLINKHRPSKVIIDCPSSNPITFKQFIKTYLQYNPKLVIEHKADYKYPVVSAASIIAKVERDKEIRSISKQIKIDLGSGYPSDERAVKAIRKLMASGDEKYIRRTWYTYKKEVEK